MTLLRRFLNLFRRRRAATRYPFPEVTFDCEGRIIILDTVTLRGCNVTMSAVLITPKTENHKDTE